MTSVRLNIIDNPCVDRAAFSKKFVIFEAKCTDYRLRETLCNDIRGTTGVLALQNDRDSRTVRFLVESDSTCWDSLKSAVTHHGRGKVVARAVSADMVSDAELIQLMLNSLRSLDTANGDSVSNASGSCLVIWKLIGSDCDPDQVVCLRFDVSYSDALPNENPLVLSCSVESYTNIRFREGGSKCIVFNPKYPFETFTQYAVIDRKLVKAPTDWKGPRFIRKGLTAFGKSIRNRVDYLDINSEDSLLVSKMEAVRVISKTFNLEYGGLVSLSFREVEVQRKGIDRNRLFKYEESRIASILSNGIYLIDHVGDESKTDILKKACCDIGFEVTVTDTVRFDAPTIHIVPDEGSVPEKDDPYGRNVVGVVQHVQAGNIRKSGATATARSIIKELALKCDIRENKIRISDWQSLGLTDDVTFSMAFSTNDGQKDCIGLLTVHPDGSMSYHSEKPYEAQEWLSELIDGRAEGIIVHGTDVISIEPTDLFPLADTAAIQRVMRDNIEHGNSPSFGMRTAASRDTLLSEVTDINTILLSDGGWLYYVGLIGKGMQTNIPTASIVRRIRAIRGGAFMDVLLNTLDATFVRNRQSTVLPYPFKYLREYIRMEGGHL